MVLGKVMAAVSALAIVLSPLLPGLSARAVSQENQETLTSGDMVQATIDQDFGKVTSQVNFDYELLMGNAEGTLSPFTAAETGEALRVKDAAEGDPGRFISSWQIRGGKPDSNVGFRITAKQNIKFSIQFQASSDWASGFFRTLKAGEEIDRTNVAKGTVEAPVAVNKTVEVQLKAGDVLLFYFGNDKDDWQTLSFTASFTADPDGYVPEDTTQLTSGEMAQAVIGANYGKVTSEDNFDYELLMGDAEGTLSPFTHSDSGDTPKVKDAAAYADETRFISSFQLRGGKAESNANVVFKMTAKKDIALTIAYEAKSDWASGYLRAVVVDPDGNRGQISSTDIAAGTADAPTVVNKEVVAHLRAGDSLLFYFGNDTADVQTIYFNAQFTADPNAFDPQQVPDTGYNTLLLGFAFVALTAALGTLLAVGKAGKAR